MTLVQDNQGYKKGCNVLLVKEVHPLPQVL